MIDGLDYNEVGDPIVINSVQFNDGFVEIQYFEKREQKDDAGMMRVLVVKNTVASNLVESILSDVHDLVDKGLLAIRDPANNFSKHQHPSDFFSK